MVSLTCMLYKDSAPNQGRWVFPTQELGNTKKDKTRIWGVCARAKDARLFGYLIGKSRMAYSTTILEDVECTFMDASSGPVFEK